MDEFHVRSERGIRQELYAHFNLIAMARLFSNHIDGILDEMILKHAVSLADTVGRAAGSILAVRAWLRPGRSFPRRSRKAVGKRSRRR